MCRKNRKSPRFEDFGKVECKEICPVCGSLDDISLTGCRLHFDAPISVNMENDYKIHLRLSRNSAANLLLLAHPQWKKENENGGGEIGFLFLHSPDTSKLESYIKELLQEQNISEKNFGIPEDEKWQFV